MPLTDPARPCGLVVASCLAVNGGRPIVNTRPAAPDALHESLAPRPDAGSSTGDGQA